MLSRRHSQQIFRTVEIKPLKLPEDRIGTHTVPSRELSPELALPRLLALIGIVGIFGLLLLS